MGKLLFNARARRAHNMRPLAPDEFPFLAPHRLAVGKRKRAKPPPKKAKPKVATVFDCPFCGKTDACGVTMDFDHKVGSIACDSCGARHESRIHRLTEPIDVYAEWIDKWAAAALHPRARSRSRRVPERSSPPRPLPMSQVRGGQQRRSRSRRSAG